MPPVVMCSNRGPLSYEAAADGTLTPKRGAGGLISGLAPVVAGTDMLWIAAALDDGDRAAAAGGTVEDDGYRVRLLDIPPRTLAAAYDVICNQTLWYAYHALWDQARRPRFDRHWFAAWDEYRDYAMRFADAVAADAEQGATVIVHDYHLALLGGLLAERRPDLVTVHFSHTPFAPPHVIRVLPAEARHELLAGMAGHRACAFHCQRWADDFAACLAAEGIDPPEMFVSPLASDADDLRSVAASPACDDALAALDAAVGDRQVIARVDRIELSKNIVRGFLAYELVLEEHAELRDRVVFAASIYPSREALPDYQAYRQEVEGHVERINERFGTETWTPILLDTEDDFPVSVARLRRYDVLLVNAVRDGLNLVAREGPLVNERDGVVCLSAETGVWDEVGDLCLEVHPFDLVQTAGALREALALGDRAARATKLRERVEARTPADWLEEVLARAAP